MLKYKNGKFNRKYKEHKCSPAFEIEDLLPDIAGLLLVIETVIFYSCLQAPALYPQMASTVLLVLCLGLYFPDFDLASYQAFRFTNHLLFFLFLFFIFIVKTKIARFPAFGSPLGDLISEWSH